MSQRCDRVHTEENLRGPRLSHSPRLQPGGEDLFLLASVAQFLKVKNKTKQDSVLTHPVKVSKAFLILEYALF